MFYFLSAIMKFIVFFFLSLFVASISHAQTYAQNIEMHTQTGMVHDHVNVYFFWGEWCPHCKKQKEFMQAQRNSDKRVTIHSYEIWGNQDNRDLFTRVASQLNTQFQGVPTTIIGDRVIVWYQNDITTGEEIKRAIEECLQTWCPDIAANESLTWLVKATKTIDVPFLWAISVSSLSPPLLTVVLWLLDGFNPCALWILLFLLGMLVQTKDKKKLIILGGTFIVASGITYFMFMVARFSIVQFLGLISRLRWGIALLWWGFGIYSLYQFYQAQTWCSVMGENKETRKSIMTKIKSILAEESMLWSIIGISVLAFSVNLLELLCSAWFPALYTSILAQTHMPRYGYYGAIASYIFFFLLDHFIIFGIAVASWNIIGISSKRSQWINLAWWIIMLILSILLISNPWFLLGG